MPIALASENRELRTQNIRTMNILIVIIIIITITIIITIDTYNYPINVPKRVTSLGLGK